MELESNSIYDVIIIGAGPAGIAAALFCLQNGKRALLISNEDHRKENNSKNETIESIHPGVSSLLGHLKIDTDLSGSIRGTYQFISDGKQKKSLNPYTEELWDGLHISKHLFTEHLMKEALKQHVAVVKDETVNNIIQKENRIIGVNTRSGKDFFAKYIIDASGNKRLVGKKLGLNEKNCSPTLVVWTGVSSSTEKLFEEERNAYFIPDQDGWTWIAQLSNGSYYWTKLSSKTKADINAPAILKNATNTVINKAANMQWRIFRPLCVAGAILCGDAAFLVDPAAGQGILFALSSGIKAAQAAMACINDQYAENMILAEYDTWIVTQFEQKINNLRDYYTTQEIIL